MRVVYRGYLMMETFGGGEVAISKDGAHISYAPSFEAASEIIDSLLD